jgi:hypothetical protein
VADQLAEAPAVALHGTDGARATRAANTQQEARLGLCSAVGHRHTIRTASLF